MIKKIIVLTTIFITISSFSQKNNISPYSFFGIGDVTETKSSHEMSMGGIGGANNSSYRLFFSNPASLGSLKLTTYTLAGSNKYTKIDDGLTKQGSSAFSLSYLALGFPAGKNAAISFGLQPFSKVGYHILNRYQNNLDETESFLFKGKGASNRVFLAYGYKLPSQISLGVEVSYIFGNLERSILHRNEEHRDRLATQYKSETDITGFSFKIGAQNTLKLKDKLEIKTGLSLLLKSKLNNEGRENIISLLNAVNPDVVIPRDNILDIESTGEVLMPLKTALSIGLGENNKWFAGLEYSFQDAISFTNNITQNNNTIQYEKNTNLAFGGFYTPNAESITAYWKRVTYTAGVHSKQTGLIVNNTSINDFGISFGVSLPSKRQLSNVNLGFDIGKRGEINNGGLIKENYYNFRLSLSLNDKWFRKRKLN